MSSGGIDTSIYKVGPAPKSFMETAGEFSTLLNNVAQNELIRTTTQKEKLDISLSELEGARKDFAAIAHLKNPTRADAQRAIAARVRMGVLTPEHGANMSMEIPETEEGIRSWANDQAEKAMTMSERISAVYHPVTTDIGGSIETSIQDYIRGTNTPMGGYTKTATPELQASRMTGYDPATGKPTSLPLPLSTNLLTRSGFQEPGVTAPPGGPGLPDVGPAPGTVPATDPNDPAAAVTVAEPTGAPDVGPVETAPDVAGGPEPAALAPSPAIPDRGGAIETAPGPYGQASIDEYLKIKTAQQSYKQNTLGLTKAIDILNKHDESFTGLGTEAVNDLKNFLVANEPYIKAVLGDRYDPPDWETADYQDLRKLMNQYTLAIASNLGGTEEQLYAAGGANPNVSLNALANRDILKMNLALERSRRAMFLEFNSMRKQSIADPAVRDLTNEDWLDFSANWAETHDISAYSADKLSAEEIGTYLNTLNETEQATYQSTLQEAIDIGLVDEDKVGDVKYPDAKK